MIRNIVVFSNGVCRWIPDPIEGPRLLILKFRDYPLVMEHICVQVK